MTLGCLAHGPSFFHRTNRCSTRTGFCWMRGSTTENRKSRSTKPVWHYAAKDQNLQQINAHEKEWKGWYWAISCPTLVVWCIYSMNQAGTLRDSLRQAWFMLINVHKLRQTQSIEDRSNKTPCYSCSSPHGRAPEGKLSKVQEFWKIQKFRKANVLLFIWEYAPRFCKIWCDSDGHFLRRRWPKKCGRTNILAFELI